MKLSRLMASLTVGVLGLLVSLYGLLALTFREGDGSTYVMIAGHHADAWIVGAIALVVGLAAILGAGILARRSPFRD